LWGLTGSDLRFNFNFDWDLTQDTGFYTTPIPCIFCDLLSRGFLKNPYNCFHLKILLLQFDMQDFLVYPVRQTGAGQFGQPGQLGQGDPQSHRPTSQPRTPPSPDGGPDGPPIPQQSSVVCPKYSDIEH
jgi:hypothetical protein